MPIVTNKMFPLDRIRATQLGAATDVIAHQSMRTMPYPILVISRLVR